MSKKIIEYDEEARYLKYTYIRVSKKDWENYTKLEEVLTTHPDYEKYDTSVILIKKKVLKMRKANAALKSLKNILKTEEKYIINYGMK
ncbi:MAG: hypothetical protein LBR18_06295 [Tannerella sp.]|jgi:hypothetical protein|nr:hypothetical protein [Tannerella sp.]